MHSISREAKIRGFLAALPIVEHLSVFRVGNMERHIQTAKRGCPTFAIMAASAHNFVWGEQVMASLQPGQAVRVNLAGLQAGDVLFHAAVTAAVGHIVRKTSDDPAKYLVKLLFSFRGVTEVEVPEDRITAT